MLCLQTRRGRCVSEEIPYALLSDLNPTNKKTISYECEYFAVWCALDAWRNIIAGQYVLIFIDNNAVRDSLISCQTSSPIAHKIMSRILDLEYMASMFTWYSRVPTHSNIADGPSRFDTSLLRRLGAECYSCHMTGLRSCLGL